MTGEGPAPQTTINRRRLAIIGGGSSGLICLKYALDMLNDWDVVCLEKSDRITGCWGNPYPGFVSTSTRYTTQFACYPVFKATVKPDGGESRAEFFRNDEYGSYLEQFAETFSLQDNIELECRVDGIHRSADGNGWDLSFTRLKDHGSGTATEHFDCVVLCTGLAAAPIPIDCDIKMLLPSELNHPDGLGQITNQRIVVVGGGESAVDYANRLSNPELNNEVFLSLQSGIRVSPRYHPIRGVPSDFLRNRLMLSIHEDIRNWIGQRFVELRIQYQETFERLFPKSPSGNEHRTVTPDSEFRDARRLRKEWAYRLTKAAKDDLFNMFHNKSDDFLDAVGDGRIQIVGAPVDRRFTTFRNFDCDREVVVNPDLVAPAVGYRATLGALSEGRIQLADFYLGCCHVSFPDLHLVGFARPIIGNIPSISEMQARYVISIVSGNVARPSRIAQLHQADVRKRKDRYKNLNMNAMYPVEMFPYCDQLARLMKAIPSLFSTVSLRSWCRTQLAPASTLHYTDGNHQLSEHADSAEVYMPTALVCFLLALKPLDWIYRVLRSCGKRNTTGD